MISSDSRRKFLKTGVLAGIASCLPIGKVIAETNLDIEELKPEEKNMVFLFQGDSITDGNRGRNADPNHTMGHGYAFSVASRIGAYFPNQGFTFFNRGISGNAVADLQKRWQADTLDLKPNVLSLLVGINDADRSVVNPGSKSALEDFKDAYRDILNQSKTLNPDTVFALGLPFYYPIGSRKENSEQWTNETSKRSKIVRKIASEFNAILIDYPSAFDIAMKNTRPEYWIWDGIHPTVPGHEIMAREWIKQVSKSLQFLKIYKY